MICGPANRHLDGASEQVGEMRWIFIGGARESKLGGLSEGPIGLIPRKSSNNASARVSSAIERSTRLGEVPGPLGTVGLAGYDIDTGDLGGRAAGIERATAERLLHSASSGGASVPPRVVCEELSELLAALAGGLLEPGAPRRRARPVALGGEAFVRDVAREDVLEDELGLPGKRRPSRDRMSSRFSRRASVSSQ